MTQLIGVDSLARVILGLVAVALALWLSGAAGQALVGQRLFRGLAWVGWAGSRVGAAVLLFGVLGMHPPSDVAQYFVPYARAVAEGSVPYRDFEMFLAPGAAYLFWLATRMADSGYAIIAAILAIDAVGLWAWSAVGQRVAGDRGERIVATIHVVSPLQLAAALMGQDEAVAVAGLGLALLLAMRGRDLAGGAVLGATVFLTKFLTGIPAPLLIVRGTWRWPMAVGLGAALACTFGPLWAIGAVPWFPLVAEGNAVEALSPGNLLYLVSIAGVDPMAFREASNLVLLAALAAWLLVWTWRPADDWSIVAAAIAATFLIWCLVGRKSWYEALMIPFVVVAFAGAGAGVGRWALLAAVIVLSALGPSLWYEWLRFGDLRILHQDGGPRVVAYAALTLVWISVKAALAVAMMRQAMKATPVLSMPGAGQRWRFGMSSISARTRPSGRGGGATGPSR